MRRIYIIFGAVLLIFPPLPRFFLFGESLSSLFCARWILSLIFIKKPPPSLPADTLPSLLSTIFFTIASPSPVPLTSCFSSSQAANASSAPTQASERRPLERTPFIYGVIVWSYVLLSRLYSAPFSPLCFSPWQPPQPFCAWAQPGQQPPQAEQPPLPRFLRQSEIPATAATKSAAATITIISIAVMTSPFFCDRPAHGARDDRG